MRLFLVRGILLEGTENTLELSHKLQKRGFVSELWDGISCVGARGLWDVREGDWQAQNVAMACLEHLPSLPESSWGLYDVDDPTNWNKHQGSIRRSKFHLQEHHFGMNQWVFSSWLWHPDKMDEELPYLLAC